MSTSVRHEVVAVKSPGGTAAVEFLKSELEKALGQRRKINMTVWLTGPILDAPGRFSCWQVSIKVKQLRTFYLEDPDVVFSFIDQFAEQHGLDVDYSYRNYLTTKVYSYSFSSR